MNILHLKYAVSIADNGSINKAAEEIHVAQPNLSRVINAGFRYSIPTLGVPVGWGDISEAKAIVECSLEDFQIEPSQGTHFFQNLTSFNVGYINVDPFGRPSTDLLDFDLLDSLPAVEETAYLRHVRLSEPLSICVDGRENRAVIS